MAQPTLDTLTLNAGSGGSDLAGDTVSSKFVQAVLVGYSTGDGSMNVVTTDAPLPVGGNTVKDGSGTAYAFLLDADGHLQVDALSCVVTNAGTFAVQAAQSGAWNITNISGTVSLPTGAATAANQATGNTALAAIQTAVELIDDAVAAEGAALGKGVLLQGDDGTDRQNVAVDTSGRLQVDIAEQSDGSALVVNGSAVTQPVSGTVTANLSAADNAVLDTIAASVAGTLTVGSHAVTNTVLSVVGGGAEATAQRVTIANDSTGVVSVDDNGSSLTVDTTGTAGLEVLQVTAADLNMTEASASAIKTAVEKIDDAISGSEILIAGGATQTNDVKVSLDSEAVVLGTGSAAIGKLAANTGVDIGDVDVTSISAGTNTIGGVIGQQSTSVAYDGTVACTIKEFMVVGTTAGNNTLVAAVVGKKIRLLSLAVIASTATANTFYLVNADYDVLGSSVATIPIAMDADGDNAAGFILSAMRRTTDTVNEALVSVQSATAALIYLGFYIEVA